MGNYVVCKYENCNKRHNFKEKNNIFLDKKDVNGKEKITRYCDEECYKNAMLVIQFKENESKEKDILNDVVKGLYGVPVNYNLPPRFWNLVQDLRNGTNRYTKFWKRHYKQGVPYTVMAEAFRMSKSEIQWAKLNKKFKGTMQEINYGLAIMQSKLVDAHKKLKKTELEEKKSKALETMNIDLMEDNREVAYKKQVSKKREDIRFLLGDD